jgi:hypothetical protein
MWVTSRIGRGKRHPPTYTLQLLNAHSFASRQDLGQVLHSYDRYATSVFVDPSASPPNWIFSHTWSSPPLEFAIRNNPKLPPPSLFQLSLFYPLRQSRSSFPPLPSFGFSQRSIMSSFFVPPQNNFGVHGTMTPFRTPPSFPSIFFARRGGGGLKLGLFLRSCPLIKR